MSSPRFTGDTLAFLRDLGANNNPEWFKANKARYETAVREPAEALIVALGDALAPQMEGLHYDTRRNGAGSMMRINRDIRFSPDKRPYKENLGIVWWFGEGRKVETPAFYLHVSADESFFYGGQHTFPKPVLSQWRDAVADEQRGGALERIIADAQAGGLRFFEEPHWKRVPRGYDAEHPRANYLRMAGCGVATTLDAEALTSEDLVDRLTGYARTARPLIDWLRSLQ